MHFKMGRFLLDQGNVQYFPNVVNEVEFNAFDIFFFNLVNVFFVFPAKDDLSDPVSWKNLLIRRSMS